MFNIPGTAFKLSSTFDALWYLPQWFDRLRNWETGQSLMKPVPEDIPSPPDDNHARNANASSTGPAIFALTIGIDNYLMSNLALPGRIQDDGTGILFGKLTGCVADADDMVNFLTETLHVPLENITNLRNGDATASRITDAFKQLADDERIQKNDHIVIFYAGHGTEASPPKGCASTDKIQTLVPYDFDPGSETNPIARNGLADYKISQLLEHIANAKGNNITVIFDSCHAGSGTRGNKMINFRTARGINLLPGTTLEDAFPASRGAMVPDKNRNKGLASHVLLAACNEHEQAFEGGGRGVFTSALTNLLKSEDLHQLTYSEIMSRLPALPSQNPQCEGKHQHRIFLQGAAPRRSIYNVKQINLATPGEYVINVGEARGVTVNAEFTVYGTKTCTDDNDVLGRLVVYRSTPFQSFLRPTQGLEPFIIPKTIGYALLTRIGNTEDVRLFVDSNSNLAGVFASLGEHVPEEYACKPSFKVVAIREDNPDLIVTASEDRAHFEITDKTCRDAGLVEISHTSSADAETMTRVLRGVADFYWNLHRTASGNHTISRTKIQFECYELELEDPDDFSGVMRCTGDNLFVNGVIQVDINDDEKAYGFSIKNAAQSLPLFVSVFYFSMSDLSIDSYYQPPSAGDKGHLATLPPGGLLTIGYGTGGCEPRTFYLEDGQDVDVGYLKLFFSTEYVDHRMIPQRSPFLSGGRVSGIYPKTKNQKVWDTMLIPIVQRRARAVPNP